jgi:hypothetical protein
MRSEHAGPSRNDNVHQNMTAKWNQGSERRNLATLIGD